MRVRLIGQMSGTRDGVPWPPRGSVVDLPDDEAISMCQNGMAFPVHRDEVETAVDNAAEMRAAAAQAEVQDSGGFIVETPATSEATLTDEEMAALEAQDERDRALVKDQLVTLADEHENQVELAGRDGTGRPMTGPGVVTTPTVVEDGEAKNGELVALRDEATGLGVKVDGRWSTARLREEIAKAKAKQ